MTDPARHRRLWLGFALAYALLTLAAGSALAKGANVVTVPVELRGVHIFVEIAVNGKPATFVLDTGASANVIAPDAVKQLGLSPGQEQTPLTGAAGQAGNVSSVKIASLDVGATRMRDQIAYMIALPEALPCDGLLGTPFLQQHVVTIDYERSQLTITPKREFSPPAKATAVPLRFSGNTPFLEAKADGCAGWFRMDTGAGNGATLFAAFAERNHLQGKYSPSVRIVTGRGVGGLLTGDLVRLPALTIGPFTFSNAVTELSRQSTGTFGDRLHAGNLGGEIWQRFTVTLDYPDHKAFLTPNARFDVPFAAPRSGLAIDTDKGINVVRDVTPNGPGAEAGIVVGDIVTAADGVPMEQIKPSDFTAMLRADPGTKVRLRIQSADKSERDVTLTLRELL